ncbi:MAG: putative 4-hydroxybenzoate polyprenyltransferase [bacterium]|nr:putative 4-hydroxybenzoate polyprenyltransferase [bacterium]
MSVLNSISNYLRMIKFSHTLFALPLAGIAFVQALPYTDLIQSGAPTPAFFWMLLKLVVAMAALRSAAMGFNRLVDRDIDGRNPRTANREIPSGAISVASAWGFVIASLAIFFAVAFWINPLCALLSPVAVFVVLGYSYTKRFTFLCHFFLGMAIGIAPTAVWIAMLERLDALPLFWSAGLMFYIAGFDILYACQDHEFDRSAGLHSVPARFGVTNALFLARACHLIALSLFAAAGLEAGCGAVFFAAIAIVAILFVIEHRLVRPGKLEQIPIAFFHINASISMILLAGVLIDLAVRA